MSTPRHSNAPHGMNPDTDWPNTEPEGVAAPLEPSPLTAKDFWRTDQQFRSPNTEPYTEGEIFACIRRGLLNPFKFAEAYAAAVSKNLQQERDRLKAELDLVDEALARRPALAHIDHRYNKIFAACAGAAKSDRLEKEIAALRETK